MEKLNIIFSIFSLYFLEELGPKQIYNIAITCKSSLIFFKELFPGIINIAKFKIYLKDPFNRSFNNEIPELGILGLKCLPHINPSIKRFCHLKKYKKDIVRIREHLIIGIDKSGSTGAFCCNILNGHYSGNKSVLDIIKIFINSIIDVINESKLDIDNITILTFDSSTDILYDYVKVNDIKINEINKITSGGGTNFDNMLYTVNNLIKNKKYVNHKLLVLTDCNCSVSKHLILDLLKNNCNINTGFIPPGAIETLKLIESYSMESGIHEKLSIDFSKQNTVIEWCKFIGNVLSNDQASIMEIDNKDSTISIYNTSQNIEGYIFQSIRPIFNINEFNENINIKCYDFSGYHEHNILSDFTNEKMSHYLFSICLKKTHNSIYKNFEKLKNEINDHNSKRKNVKILNNKIKENFKLLKNLKRHIYLEKNKKKLKESCKIILRWYKNQKFIHRLLKVINDGNLTKNIIVYRLQKIYKKNRKRFLDQYTLLPVPYLRGNNYMYKNSILCDIQFNKREILKILNTNKYDIETVKKNQSIINDLDVTFFERKITKLICKLNSINKILKIGIEKSYINCNFLNQKYNNITLKETTLVLQNNFFTVYKPLISIPDYIDYSYIIDNCITLKNELNEYLNSIKDKVNCEININSAFNYSPNFINKTPNVLFRECSAPRGETVLSRQVSCNVYNSPAVHALRSISSSR